eukprot:175130_1
MTRFATNEYEDGKTTTIGIDFKIKTLEIDDIKVKFQIWDTNGVDRFATIRCAYYRGSHAIMIVYNLRDRESFHGVNDFLREIAQYSNDKTIIMLLGNQADNHNSFKKREVTTAEAEQFARDNDLYFMEVSAKTGMNVEKAFAFVGRQLIQIKSQTPFHQKIRNILQENNLPGIMIYISWKSPLKLV